MSHTVEPLLPLLARGRHRSPKRGACFMEFASYLAGERWSDHPACTTPALASLARLVNDVVDDESRARLVPLIPRVVGLAGDDGRVAIVLSALAAGRSIPIASEYRQRALAIALLRLRRLLAMHRDEASLEAVSGIDRALALAPAAERWALRFERSGMGGERVRPLADGDESILLAAVLGIVEACVDDPNRRLVTLLGDAIETTERMLHPGTPNTPARVPAVTAALAHA